VGNDIKTKEKKMGEKRVDGNSENKGKNQQM
jgi:hypothetical protein